MSSAARIFEFGEFQLNVSEQRLLRGGQPVALPPKAFELLVALVERGGQLVTRETLLKRGWPDTFVEAGSLSYNISLIRKALEDDHGHRMFIETVPKRGYRFVAARVTELLQPVMSVLVLPFGWDPGDPVLEDVADGLAEGLINTLSQISRVRVIARVTAFIYKGQAVDVRRVADDLRVSAVLTGRVARRSDAVTAHVEIVDPASMAQVWGETYRQPASDLLAAQQAITAAVAERLDVALAAIERLQLPRTQPADPASANGHRTSESPEPAPRSHERSRCRHP